MSLLKSIEFFFSRKVKHHIPFALKKADSIRKDTIAPSAPMQKEIRPSFVPKKETKLPTPKPVKRIPKEPSQDAFYTEWERKYKALHAENLLAKEPQKKHALFIIDEKGPQEFARKIAGAVNTRLMKTTFIASNKSVEELIKEHAPTHLILDKQVTTSLPTIFTEDLHLIEKDAAKKKLLWEKLQAELKT